MEKLEITPMEKFKNVEVDEDTKIRSKKYIKVGEFDAKVEKWYWEGITAWSLILCKADVEGLTHEELIALIRQEINIQDNFTFKDTGEYLFFNYGFEY